MYTNFKHQCYQCSHFNVNGITENCTARHEDGASVMPTTVVGGGRVPIRYDQQRRHQQNFGGVAAHRSNKNPAKRAYRSLWDLTS